MNKLLAPSMALGLLITTATVGHTATFAQFLQMTGAQNFSFSGGNAGFLTSTMNPIFFQFKSGSGFTINAPLDTNIGANITFTSQGNGAPVASASSGQAMRNLDFTISTGAAQTLPGGFVVPMGAILLHGTTGLVNPTAGTLSGGPTDASYVSPIAGFANTLVFNSDYINFAGAFSTGASISMTPGLTTTPNTPPGIGLMINPFTAAGTGTFTAQSPVPEPGTVALLSSITVCGAAFGVRRLRRRK